MTQSDPSPDALARAANGCPTCRGRGLVRRAKGDGAAAGYPHPGFDRIDCHECYRVATLIDSLLGRWKDSGERCPQCGLGLSAHPLVAEAERRGRERAVLKGSALCVSCPTDRDDGGPLAAVLCAECVQEVRTEGIAEGRRHVLDLIDAHMTVECEPLRQAVRAALDAEGTDDAQS